jgi:hypothetical protein
MRNGTAQSVMRVSGGPPAWPEEGYEGSGSGEAGAAGAAGAAVPSRPAEEPA